MFRRKLFKATAALLTAVAVSVGFSGSSAMAAGLTSELTGLPVDASLVNQRPIAVMVDNESLALDHYNTANADIVYEMVNSTANNRITRLMCLYKDWKNIPQTGNIRSVRPTNILLAQEYNAVIVHDGGPYHVDGYLARYNQHLSANFSRVPNGKARVYTEFVFGNELVNRMAAAGFSSTYTVPTGDHFNFGVSNIASAGIVNTANNISLPFPHNASKLAYNAASKTYNYYEYGRLHQDVGTRAPLSFTNVIIQNVPMHQLDANGYMIYNVIGSGNGWYITNGMATPINWVKSSESGVTTYTTADGQPLVVNPGKTYVGLVPSDSWASLSIQ